MPTATRPRPTPLHRNKEPVFRCPFCGGWTRHPDVCNTCWSMGVVEEDHKQRRERRQKDVNSRNSDR